MRKNLGIWKTWQPMDGGGLHGVQLCILQRAMKMLTPQGRVVYSKCSLNPVENEANIACALRNNQDFRLVDVSVKLPALHQHPGLTAWRPTDKSLCTTYNPYDTFMKTCTGGDMVKAKMSRGHWPPEDVEKLEMPADIPSPAGHGRVICRGARTQENGGRGGRGSRGTVEELKREADDSAEIPEPKKPRLDADGVAPKVEDIAAKVEDVAAKAEEAPKAPAPPPPSPLCPPFHSFTYFFLLHRHGRGSDRKQHLDPAYSAPAPASTSARNPVSGTVSGTWVRTDCFGGGGGGSRLRDFFLLSVIVLFLCFLPVGLHRTFLGGKFATL
ncbi:hypothetical protein K438DRAFT_1937673 [Mycena galopus ATCC 62051]|nr:hypothetical protein K438DRAFT_1937673 [Mycena galopus ATCC 62051]